MDITLYILIPIVAFLYASVGHGGASGYLALMALFGVPPQVMKPNALILNIFISAISFYQFWRAGHFRWSLFLIFAIGSIPASFLGGMMEVDTFMYKLILAVFLVFSVLKLVGLFQFKTQKEIPFNWVIGISIGALIGFFSGLIGIGGGIILSPIIVLINWGSLKEAAAVSALFIWVNSISGLLGQITHGIELSSEIWILVALAMSGGYAGAYFGSRKFDNRLLRYILAFVLAFACFKLLLV